MAQTTTLESPIDLLHYQLRTALTMEDDSLGALGELAEAAKSTEIQELFRHHAEETEEQIDNLHKVLELLSVRTTAAPSPSTKGISKQAASLIEKSAPELRDQVTLACALGNEHYEISAYQTLILATEAMGEGEAVALLRANLDQETHTSEELHSALEALTQRHS